MQLDQQNALELSAINQSFPRAAETGCACSYTYMRLAACVHSTKVDSTNAGAVD